MTTHKKRIKVALPPRSDKRGQRGGSLSGMGTQHPAFVLGAPAVGCLSRRDFYFPGGRPQCPTRFGAGVPGTAEGKERHCQRHIPPLLDPFAGGGGIPLKVQRLGLAGWGDLYCLWHSRIA